MCTWYSGIEYFVLRIENINWWGCVNFSARSGIKPKNTDLEKLNQKSVDNSVFLTFTIVLDIIPYRSKNW